MKIFVCCGFDLLLLAVIAAVVSDDNLFDAPICLSTLSSYETVFGLYQCFFSLVGGVGGVRGRGMKIDHTQTVSATASRKDT